MTEMFILTKVELTERGHMVCLLVIDPVIVDNGKIVVDCTGESDWHGGDSFSFVCFSVEHLQSTAAVSTTNSTLIVGSFQAVFLLAKRTLKDQEAAIDRMTRRDVASAEIHRSSSPD